MVEVIPRRRLAIRVRRATTTGVNTFLSRRRNPDGRCPMSRIWRNCLVPCMCLALARRFQSGSSSSPLAARLCICRKGNYSRRSGNAAIIDKIVDVENGFGPRMNFSGLDTRRLALARIGSGSTSFPATGTGANLILCVIARSVARSKWNSALFLSWL